MYSLFSTLNFKVGQDLWIVADVPGDVRNVGPVGACREVVNSAGERDTHQMAVDPAFPSHRGIGCVSGKS